MHKIDAAVVHIGSIEIDANSMHLDRNWNRRMACKLSNCLVAFVAVCWLYAGVSWCSCTQSDNRGWTCVLHMSQQIYSTLSVTHESNEYAFIINRWPHILPYFVCVLLCVCVCAPRFTVAASVGFCMWFMHVHVCLLRPTYKSIMRASWWTKYTHEFHLPGRAYQLKLKWILICCHRHKRRDVNVRWRVRDIDTAAHSPQWASSSSPCVHIGDVSIKKTVVRINFNMSATVHTAHTTFFLQRQHMIMFMTPNASCILHVIRVPASNTRVEWSTHCPQSLLLAKKKKNKSYSASNAAGSPYVIP